MCVCPCVNICFTEQATPGCNTILRPRTDWDFYPSVLESNLGRHLSRHWPLIHLQSELPATTYPASCESLVPSSRFRAKEIRFATNEGICHLSLLESSGCTLGKLAPVMTVVSEQRTITCFHVKSKPDNPMRFSDTTKVRPMKDRTGLVGKWNVNPYRNVNLKRSRLHKHWSRPAERPVRLVLKSGSIKKQSRQFGHFRHSFNISTPPSPPPKKVHPYVRPPHSCSLMAKVCSEGLRLHLTCTVPNENPHTVCLDTQE